MYFYGHRHRLQLSSFTPEVNNDNKPAADNFQHQYVHNNIMMAEGFLNSALKWQAQDITSMLHSSIP